jgi:hypothetical protein
MQRLCDSVQSNRRNCRFSFSFPLFDWTVTLNANHAQACDKVGRTPTNNIHDVVNLVPTQPHIVSLCNSVKQMFVPASDELDPCLSRIVFHVQVG